MNSNTHNRTTDNLPLFTPSIIIPTLFVIHQLSIISNTSTVDFERLSQQYALSIRPTTKLPKITNLTLLTKK